MFRHRRCLMSVAILVLGLGLAGSAFAQDDQTRADIDQLKKDVETLKQVQKAIIMELRTMRAQRPVGGAAELPPNAQAVDVAIDITGVPKIGSPNATVAIVEFSDFECPYCGQHFEAILPRIEDDYVKTGKALYFVRDFPIAKLHPHALKAAEAGRCAADQGKFWQMHDMMFSNQDHLQPMDLLQYAGLIGLDHNAFQQCLSSGMHTEDVKQAIAYGITLGVSATPTFFIGRIDASRHIVHAVAELPGAYPFTIFKDAIEKALNTRG